MEDFILSGRVTTVMLVVLAAEVMLVGFYLWRKGMALPLLSIAASGMAGGALVLALRAALQEAGWLFVAMYLLAALLAHLADIALRLMSASRARGMSSTDT